MLVLCLASGAARKSRGAVGDIKQQCADAYVDNQKLRRAGKLMRARERLLVCAQVACPDAIKVDCVAWLDQLSRQIPTIVVAATAADGSDTTAVRLLVDGVVRAERLDGRPLGLDPGTHRLRFEQPGQPPIERRLVIRQGVQNRRIEVAFGSTAPSAGTAKPAGPATTEQPPATVQRPQPIAAYLLGGAGLVAFGVATGFGVAGKTEVADLDQSCGSKAPPPFTRTCTDDQVAVARNELIVADVALATGGAALVTGLVLLLYNRLSAPERTPASQVRFVPHLAGGVGLLSGSF